MATSEQIAQKNQAAEARRQRRHGRAKRAYAGALEAADKAYAAALELTQAAYEAARDTVKDPETTKRASEAHRAASIEAADARGKVRREIREALNVTVKGLYG